MRKAARAALPLLLLAASPPPDALPRPPLPRPPLPTLSGIATGGNGRVAILRTAAGASLPLQEGDVLDGRTVRRIGPDSVTLEAEGHVAELRLAAAGAPAAPDTGGPTFGLVVNPPAPAPD